MAEYSAATPSGQVEFLDELEAGVYRPWLQHCIAYTSLKDILRVFTHSDYVNIAIEGFDGVASERQYGFFSRLKEDVAKVDRFYSRRRRKLTKDTQALGVDVAALLRDVDVDARSVTPPSASLASASGFKVSLADAVKDPIARCAQLQRRLAQYEVTRGRLEVYADFAFRGFDRLLKKYDKRTGCETRRDFQTHVLKRQRFVTQGLASVTAALDELKALLAHVTEVLDSGAVQEASAAYAAGGEESASGLGDSQSEYSDIDLDDFAHIVAALDDNEDRVVGKGGRRGGDGRSDGRAKGGKKASLPKVSRTPSNKGAKKHRVGEDEAANAGASNRSPSKGSSGGGGGRNGPEEPDRSEADARSLGVCAWPACSVRHTSSLRDIADHARTHILEIPSRVQVRQPLFSRTPSVTSELSSLGGGGGGGGGGGNASVKSNSPGGSPSRRFFPDVTPHDEALDYELLSSRGEDDRTSRTARLVSGDGSTSNLPPEIIGTPRTPVVLTGPATMGMATSALAGDGTGGGGGGGGGGDGTLTSGAAGDGTAPARSGSNADRRSRLMPADSVSDFDALLVASPGVQTDATAFGDDNEDGPSRTAAIPRIRSRNNISKLLVDDPTPVARGSGRGGQETYVLVEGASEGSSRPPTPGSGSMASAEASDGHLSDRDGDAVQLPFSPSGYGSDFADDVENEDAPCPSSPARISRRGGHRASHKHERGKAKSVRSPSETPTRNVLELLGEDGVAGSSDDGDQPLGGSVVNIDWEEDDSEDSRKRLRAGRHAGKGKGKERPRRYSALPEDDDLDDAGLDIELDSFYHDDRGDGADRHGAPGNGGGGGGGGVGGGGLGTTGGADDHEDAVRVRRGDQAVRRLPSSRRTTPSPSEEDDPSAAGGGYDPSDDIVDLDLDGGIDYDGGGGTEGGRPPRPPSVGKLKDKKKAKKAKKSMKSMKRAKAKAKSGGGGGGGGGVSGRSGGSGERSTGSDKSGDSGRVVTPSVSVPRKTFIGRTDSAGSVGTPDGIGIDLDWVGDETEDRPKSAHSHHSAGSGSSGGSHGGGGGHHTGDSTIRIGGGTSNRRTDFHRGGVQWA